ncbi:MAG: hypothetical protein H0X29_00945 [Parachlamydiaceae bacterium]|nr:hypothetical protein [Parachlamydiaceae bacterium]
MQFQRNNFFAYNDTYKQIEGFWAPTTTGGAMKINCALGEGVDHKIYINITTQTFAQRFFSAFASFITLGYVKDFFKNEIRLIRTCNIDFAEVKSIIIHYYQDMVSAKVAAVNTDMLTKKFFRSLTTVQSSRSNTPFSPPTPLTSEQLAVADKLKRSTIIIVRNVLTFFLDPKIREMNPLELKKVLDVAKEDTVPSLNLRSEKFFFKMMQPIDQMINEMKGMKEAFTTLAVKSGDSDIRKKIVEGIACGYLNNLMEELDIENPSIVDNIINS